MFRHHLENALSTAIKKGNEDRVVDLVSAINCSYSAHLTSFNAQAQNFLNIAFQSNNLAIVKYLYAQICVDEVFMKKIKLKEQSSLIFFLGLLSFEKSFNEFLQKRAIQKEDSFFVDVYFSKEASFVEDPAYYKISLLLGVGLGFLTLLILLILTITATLGVLSGPMILVSLPAMTLFTMMGSVILKKMVLAAKEIMYIQGALLVEAEKKRLKPEFEQLQNQIQNLLDADVEEVYLDRILFMKREINTILTLDNRATESYISKILSIHKTLVHLEKTILKDHYIDPSQAKPIKQSQNPRFFEIAYSVTTSLDSLYAHSTHIPEAR